MRSIKRVGSDFIETIEKSSKSLGVHESTEFRIEKSSETLSRDVHNVHQQERQANDATPERTPDRMPDGNRVMIWDLRAQNMSIQLKIQYNCLMRPTTGLPAFSEDIGDLIARYVGFHRFFWIQYLVEHLIPITPNLRLQLSPFHPHWGVETPEELMTYLESVEQSQSFDSDSDFESTQDSNWNDSDKVDTLFFDGASPDAKKRLAPKILATRLGNIEFKVNPFLREVLTTALVANNDLMSEYIRDMQKDKVLPSFNSLFVSTAEMKAAILMRSHKKFKEIFFVGSDSGRGSKHFSEKLLLILYKVMSTLDSSERKWTHQAIERFIQEDDEKQVIVSRLKCLVRRCSGDMRMLTAYAMRSLWYKELLLVIFEACKCVGWVKRFQYLKPDNKRLAERYAHRAAKKARNNANENAKKKQRPLNRKRNRQQPNDSSRDTSSSSSWSSECDD